MTHGSAKNSAAPEASAPNGAGVAWVAAGRRSAHISDGRLRDNLHFAAGIAPCEAAGCVVSDLGGNALHTGRGLVVSADPETHDRMLAVVEPRLRARHGSA